MACGLVRLAGGGVRAPRWSGRGAGMGSPARRARHADRWERAGRGDRGARVRAGDRDVSRVPGRRPPSAADVRPAGAGDRLRAVAGHGRGGRRRPGGDGRCGCAATCGARLRRPGDPAGREIGAARRRAGPAARARADCAGGVRAGAARRGHRGTARRDPAGSSGRRSDRTAGSGGNVRRVRRTAAAGPGRRGRPPRGPGRHGRGRVLVAGRGRRPGRGAARRAVRRGRHGAVRPRLHPAGRRIRLRSPACRAGRRPAWSAGGLVAGGIGRARRRGCRRLLLHRLLRRPRPGHVGGERDRPGRAVDRRLARIRLRVGLRRPAGGTRRGGRRDTAVRIGWPPPAEAFTRAPGDRGGDCRGRGADARHAFRDAGRREPKPCRRRTTASRTEPGVPSRWSFPRPVVRLPGGRGTPGRCR